MLVKRTCSISRGYLDYYVRTFFVSILRNEILRERESCGKDRSVTKRIKVRVNNYIQFEGELYRRTIKGLRYVPDADKRKQFC